MGTQNSFRMVSPPGRLMGLLVPVLVIPLGLLALKVLGIVAIFMVVELARIPVLYSPSVAAVSLAALCRVVDGFLLQRRVDFVLRVFWVRVLAVVAPVALWRSGGPSLAAGWVAAASASVLMLWANLRRSFWRAVDGVWVWLVARAWLDVRRLLWAAGETCGALRGWCSHWFLSFGVLFSDTAFSSRSGLQLRAYWRLGSGEWWAAAGIMLICMLPGSEAVGDAHELVADLLQTTGCCSILWLLVPEGSDPQIICWIGSFYLAVRMWQWLVGHQEPRNSEQRASAVGTAQMQTTATAKAQVEIAGVEPRHCRPGVHPGRRKAVEAVTTSWDGQSAEVAHCIWSMFREEGEEATADQIAMVAVTSVSQVAAIVDGQRTVTAEMQSAEVTHCLLSMFQEEDHEKTAVVEGANVVAMVALPQRTRDRSKRAMTEAETVVTAAMDQVAVVVEKRAAEMAAGTQAAEERYEAAVATEMVVVAAAAAEGQSAAEEQQQPEKQQQRASRRRHRVRRRANGAPRSCVLESGRWINLPRARRAAAHTIAVVQVRKQRRKQQPCRFNDSNSGCKRSQCRYAPAGHAPAVDGADVLDPLVAAKLENLVGSVQAGLEQRQQEQLQRLQLQQQRSIDQLRLQLEQQEQQLQSLRDGQWQQQQQHQHQAMEGKGQQQRQQNKEISAIRASCEQQKAKYLRGAISGLQAEIHDLKRNVTLSYPFEVEMRHAIEDIDRLKATFTRRGIALSMLDVANTQ